MNRGDARAAAVKLVYEWEMGGEGGEETRLTDAPGLDDGPEYSPDGRHLWFCSVRSGLMQIWSLP